MLARVLAVLLVLVSGWGLYQTGRIHRLQLEVAQERAAATAQALQLTQERQAALGKVTDEARTQVAAARRDAAAARAGADSLRTAAAAAGRACGAASAGGSDPAAGTGPVLADVLGRADDVAGELAAALDESRAAGLACERAYRAVTAGR